MLWKTWNLWEGHVIRAQTNKTTTIHLLSLLPDPYYSLELGIGAGEMNETQLKLRDVHSAVDREISDETTGTLSTYSRG